MSREEDKMSEENKAADDRLPWQERVTCLCVNPEMATLKDIIRLAEQNIAMREWDEIRANDRARYAQNEAEIIRAFVAEVDKQAKRIHSTTRWPMSECVDTAMRELLKPYEQKS